MTSFTTFFCYRIQFFGWLCLLFAMNAAQAQFYINTVKLEKLSWVAPTVESTLNTGTPITIAVQAQCDAPLEVANFEVWVNNNVTNMQHVTCENNTFKGVIILPNDKVHTLFVRASKGTTVKQTTVLTVLPPEKATIPLSGKDIRDVKNRAVALVSNLATWYNNILASNSAERKELIINMVIPGEEQLFLNDGIIVEDDFDTRSKVPKNERDKKIEKYFSDLGAYFGISDDGNFRNENEALTVTNATTSNVRPEKRSSVSEPLFVDVHFMVNYQGIDNRTQKPYKSSQRLAELEARNDSKTGTWRLYIRSLRFDNLTSGGK